MLAVRAIAMAGGLAAGLTSSQLPEFAQQYRQRLGGAIDELRVVVERFEADAKANSLTAADAIKRLIANADDLVRKQGLSAELNAQRLTALSEQKAAMDQAGPLGREVSLINNADSTILRGAYAAYEPAVPLTTEGIATGLGGFLAGFAAMIGLTALWRRLFRRAPAAEPIKAG